MQAAVYLQGSFGKCKALHDNYFSRLICVNCNTFTFARVENVLAYIRFANTTFLCSGTTLVHLVHLV